MIQKRSVHRFAHGVVSAKGKRNVADPAAHPRTGQIGFNPAGRFDKIDGVIAMLVQAGRDRENIWIKNDIVGAEAGTLRQ